MLSAQMLLATSAALMIGGAVYINILAWKNRD